MAHYRKLKSGKWSAQIERNGVRTSRAFNTKAQATAWAAGVESDILNRARGQITRKTLRQALERYASDVTPTKRGASKEGPRIAFLAESLGFSDKWLEDVSADDFGRWRDRQLQGVKASTVNRDLNLLSAILSRCRDEWGWLHKSPLTKFKRPRNPKPRDRLITWREIRAVLRELKWHPSEPAFLQQEVGFAFLMALHTGMRAGEVLSYVLKDGAAYLAETKNGDERYVPLSTRAMRLHRLCPRYTITSASLDAMFRKARVRAGLDGFTFHDARRTATTRLAKKVDPLTLAKITGHHDLKILMDVYYKPSMPELLVKVGR